jgi:hypothetical protein
VSNNMGWLAGGSGAVSMLWFRLERGGDGMKCCWKMKRMLYACLGSMGRKRDTAWWNGLMQILLDQKMKKNHSIDSAATNGW